MEAYITMDSHWQTQPCPKCGHDSIGHGFLFREPPPINKIEDGRKPFNEVFLHQDREDCLLLSSTAH